MPLQMCQVPARRYSEKACHGDARSSSKTRAGESPPRTAVCEVPPALKAGNLVKARASFKNFDDNWDSIEDLIKARSADAYVAIEKGMIEIEEVLMPEKPDAGKATALVNDVMTRYNAVLGEIAKDARAANR